MGYHHLLPRARLFLFFRIWQDLGGILSIFWFTNYKESTQRRGIRSNAGLGASGYILFSFIRISIWFSFVLRICHITTCHDSVNTHDLSADRWLDVSFVLVGFAGCICHDGMGIWRHISGWICLRISV